MDLKNAKPRSTPKKPVKKKTVKKKKEIQEEHETINGYNVVKNQRFFAIQECKKCNGKPPEVPFELGTMEGYKCGICWEVLGWKKK